MLLRCENLDHRTERILQLLLVDVLERQIDAAVRRAAAGLDLLVDRVGQDIARGVVGPAVRLAVAVQEFLAIAVEQPPAELDAGRLPGRRIEPDHARAQDARSDRTAGTRCR